MNTGKILAGSGRYRLIATLVVSAILSVGFTSISGPAHAEASTSKGTLSVTRNGTRSEVKWVLRDKTQKARVFRNGEIISQTQGDGNAIDELNTLTPATYVLDISHTPTKYEIQDIPDDQVRAEALNNPDLYSTVDLVGLDIGPSSGENSANASTAAATTLFRYQAFIRDAVIGVNGWSQLGCTKGPVQLSSADYFFGDNRSYAPDPIPNTYSPAYRTRFDVKMDWVNKSVVPDKRLGVTNLMHYTNDSTQGVYSLVPDGSSMKVVGSTISSTNARFQITQDVHDPFCSSNGIWFDIIVNVARSGSFSLSGTRIQVPNHEIYIKDSDATGWTSVMKAPPLSMDCLNPLLSGFLGCNADLSVSGTR